MVTSQKDSCRAQYLHVSLLWHYQYRLIKCIECHLKQLLIVHIYFKMNKENQSVRTDKDPMICICCVLLMFLYSSRLPEKTGLKQTNLKIRYPAHAELLVAKVARWKIC